MPVRTLLTPIEALKLCGCEGLGLDELVRTLLTPIEALKLDMRRLDMRRLDVRTLLTPIEALKRLSQEYTLLLSFSSNPTYAD